MDKDALARFEATNMGWLTAEGDLLPCTLHNHLEALATVPRFAEAYERYDQIRRSNAEDMQRDLESLEPDEHPAMHRFDGMDDDARDELMKVAYTAGWIRLGRSFDTRTFGDAGTLSDVMARTRASVMQAMREPLNWYVEAVGLTEHVRRHRRALGRVADGLGCRLVAREMKYATVNFGTKRRPDARDILVPEAYEAA